MPVNIAIDGPSGAGKSTVAKEVAKLFSLSYVDTGAIYRTVGYYFIKKGIEPSQENMKQEIRNINISVIYDKGVQKVILNGEDATEHIRTPQASMMASKVSAYAEVREKLLSVQRDIAARNNVIMDGRDIGTTILPQADLKIYLTASVASRADRRYKELTEKGESVTLDEVTRDIEQRDYDDSHREISPLKQAEDAILVDSSDMTLSESIEAVAALIRGKGLCGGTKQ